MLLSYKEIELLLNIIRTDGWETCVIGASFKNEEGHEHSSDVYNDQLKAIIKADTLKTIEKL